LASTQTTATLTKDLQTYYDNMFLEGVDESLILAQFADVKNVPLYRGKVIDFFRRPPITPDSTEITEGSKTDNQIDFKGQTLQATVKHYAFWSEHTKFISLISRDPELATLVKEYGVGAAKAVDDILMAECILRGSVPLRVDQLSVYTTNSKTGIVDASAGNSTVLFFDASISDTNAWFVGAHIACFEPTATNYGYGGQVISNTAVGTTVGVSPAAPVAFDSDTNYRMVSGSGLSAKMTGSAIKYGVALLRDLKAPAFDNDWYYMLMGNPVMNDLMDDTIWLAVQEYHGEKDSLIPNGYVKSLWGVKTFRLTRPYRETVGGAASATGAVWCSPILGRHALARVDLAGYAEPKIIIKSPGPGDTSQPYNETKTIAADMYFAAKAINAAFAVNIMSGATSVLT